MPGMSVLRLTPRRYALLLLWLFAVPARADDAPARSAEERMLDGEVIVTPKRVDGFAIPLMHVEAIFDVAPERVWALVTDCYGYRNTMPRVMDSVETERQGVRSLCKWTVNMPFPFSNLVTTIEARSVATPPQQWHREYKQVSGDFIRNEGYWHIERYGDDGKRARVTYHAHSVMDSAVPDAFVRRGQIKAMHEMIGKMRAALK